MSRAWNGIGSVVTVVAVGACVLVSVVLTVVGYVMNTPPLHPDAQRVPSVTDRDPAPRWADAVKRGREIARATLAEQSLPGLSVAVGVDGEIVWAEGFGFADLDRHAPVTPATRFRIGTASTVLTSAAVGLLLQNHRLELDNEIEAIVPEFPKKPWPVTLRQVMGHVAGVRSDGGDEGPLFSKHCERPLDAFPAFAKRRLLFEPGTRYRFSRYGWILVSAAVESAAKQPFLTFMRDNVFAPLGMNETTADPETVPDRATSYFPRFAENPRYGVDPMRPIDMSCYAGAGAFVSTASDLVRFGLAINGGKLLHATTLQSLQTAQRLPSGEETGYGLGWNVATVTLKGQRTRRFGHDGAALGGTVASLMTFPDRRLAVAVISNISYADTPSLASTIAEAFAN